MSNGKMQKYFESLRENIGKRVVADHVFNGVNMQEVGELRRVNDYSDVRVGSFNMPFIGYMCAVRKIETEDGQILYHNTLIEPNYYLTRQEDIDEVRGRSFGWGVTRKLRRKHGAIGDNI